MQLTNATKAAVIGAVNAVLGLLAAFGIAFSPNTDFKIATGSTIVLSAITYLTRKKSPKWIEDIAPVAAVVTEVATDATPAKKPATKKTPATK